MKQYTNQLIHESSPYLLQHAHNPVNWFPWGKEALQKAKAENKLLLISIGYSACHWCHVMERESFENESIARIMNDNYVCIKVDREERPDIDHIYMNAVQMITGAGGWPLNCFALPDGKPVYGGTYFRSEQWKDILENLALSYRTDASKFIKAADDLKEGIVSLENIEHIKDSNDFYYEEMLEIMLSLRKRFDHQHGGSWGAPKFPMPVSYYPLMRYAYHTQDKDMLKHVYLSLEKIATGGIYDHLAGGFARYTVDREWLVPHFEKMLYDNAQLVSLYSEAYRINQNPMYKKVVSETIDFIVNEMMSPGGGFYSSFDADSEGKEGQYYVWDKYEVDVLLKDDSPIFCDYYNVTQEGNWEGRNILNIKQPREEIASKYKITEDELDVIIERSKSILLTQRKQRVKPGLDDKILTSWNALTMKAFVDAYNVFGDEKYLETALKVFGFIEKNLLKPDFSLFRNYKNGKATIDAFLDDYALLIEALTELYQATFNEKFIQLSLKLSEFVLENFFDSSSHMFYYTHKKSTDLIVRTKELSDNVIPASNSVMAKNLFRLGHFYLNQAFIDKAQQMLLNMRAGIRKGPYFYSNWIDLMIQFIHKPFEVCIVGKQVEDNRKMFFTHYLPNIILAGGKGGELPLLEGRHTTGKTVIYICKDKVCNTPVKSFNEALRLISEE